MANIPELQEAILKALDAVVTQRNNDLKLDKTVTAIIKKNVGLRHGKSVYQVEYSGGNFEAVCQNENDIYTPKTSVLVLVPEGNFSKEKIIIGRASSISTDRSASVVAAAVNQFSIVGTNLLESKENIKTLQYGLRSFHPVSADNKIFHDISHRYQTIYDINSFEDENEENHSKIKFNDKRLNVYKDDSTALMVRADFQTNLDLAQKQQAGARYGLIFNFVFDNLNKGYGETNGEIFRNIGKDIIYFLDQSNDNSSVSEQNIVELNDNFIAQIDTNLNIDQWVAENTGYIDQHLEAINAAYLKFKEKTPEKNTEIVSSTILAYELMINDLKNMKTIAKIKNEYDRWMNEAIGDLQDKTVSYVWTSDDMIGNPMSFNSWNSQYQIFNIDFKTFNHLENIIFFKEGFIENEKYEQQWPISEINNGGGPDIFVRNLQIYAMNPMEIQSGDYTLKVEPETGYDVIFSTTDSDEEIYLKATFTRKMYEDLSKNSKTSYIWFKEDPSVVNAQSNYYHSLGGIGWRKVSEGTSSSRTFIVKSEDNQAYKNNYKCVAIYEPEDDKVIVSYPFVIYNEAAKIELKLESDLGTHFSYDAGAPTIRILIEDADNPDDFIEKGYSEEESDPLYKYKWAISDSANKYTLFLDEIFETDENTSSENIMLSSVKKEQLNKIEKFVYFKEELKPTSTSWRATRIKYPVSISSTGFTVTCYVQKRKETFDSDIVYNDVGSVSLEFLNQEESITSDYRINIINGDQVFQYDEYGNTPTSEKKKNPLEILPLQAQLFTPSGVEVAGTNYQVEWIFPIKDTMILKNTGEKFQENPATKLEQLLKGREVSFDIEKIYNPDAYANQITCHISFNGRDYYKDTNFYFGKQGSNGTNGTDVVAKINYIDTDLNKDLSILNREPLILYLQKGDDNAWPIKEDDTPLGIKKIMFNVDKSWSNSDPFYITKSKDDVSGLKLSLYQKNTEIAFKTCLWNIAGNTQTKTNKIGKYFDIISTEGSDNKTDIIFNKKFHLNEKDDGKDYYDNYYLQIQNIRAQAEVDGQTYYAFYSLPIIEYEEVNEDEGIKDVASLLSKNRISIEKQSYLNEIIYNADGRNPIYNHNQGLKLINIPDSISKIEFTVKGGLRVKSNDLEYKDKYALSQEDSPAIGLLTEKDNEEIEFDITLEKLDKQWKIIDNKDDEEDILLDSPMVYVRPQDTFDGSITNNRIEAKLYGYFEDLENPDNNRYYLVATVYAPINITLNTFGLASLNAWDGNTVTIDEEEGYVMAPQIGAGEKDSNNRFTGVLMGKTETSTGHGENEKETGLFGYSHGLQSMFLDAKTGNAYFGLPDGYYFDPDADEPEPLSVVQTNEDGTDKSYEEQAGQNYHEGRIELIPGGISKIGGWRLGRSSMYYITQAKRKKTVVNDNGKTVIVDLGENYSEEPTSFTYEMIETGSPYRGDYRPDERGTIIDDKENYSGPYNQYHIRDIPHNAAGILLQAGTYPYISIKGKPLEKSEIFDIEGSNKNSVTKNTTDPDPDKYNDDSDSYLKPGDSLELQLDPSTPSLFTIFRHNHEERKKKSVDGNESEIKYRANSRTFLAGINGRGEFVANTIRNVTTTLPAEINAGEESPETSYTTNFSVNTIPAFGDFNTYPSHIGFKMTIGNNTLGQLFISARGMDPSKEWVDDNEIWNLAKADTLMKNNQSFSQRIARDATLKISGGSFIKKDNTPDSQQKENHGEYYRPLSLYGKRVSLFSTPNDIIEDDIKESSVSNNHFILETDNGGRSRAQLFLGEYDFKDSVWPGTQIDLFGEPNKDNKIFVNGNLETRVGRLINQTTTAKKYDINQDPNNPEYIFLSSYINRYKKLYDKNVNDFTTKYSLKSDIAYNSENEDTSLNNRITVIEKELGEKDKVGSLANLYKVSQEEGRYFSDEKYENYSQNYSKYFIKTEKDNQDVFFLRDEFITYYNKLILEKNFLNILAKNYGQQYISNIFTKEDCNTIYENDIEYKNFFEEKVDSSSMYYVDTDLIYNQDYLEYNEDRIPISPSDYETEYYKWNITKTTGEDSSFCRYIEKSIYDSQPICYHLYTDGTDRQDAVTVDIGQNNGTEDGDGTSTANEWNTITFAYEVWVLEQDFKENIYQKQGNKYVLIENPSNITETDYWKTASSPDTYTQLKDLHYDPNNKYIYVGSDPIWKEETESKHLEEEDLNWSALDDEKKEPYLNVWAQRRDGYFKINKTNFNWNSVYSHTIKKGETEDKEFFFYWSSQNGMWTQEDLNNLPEYKKARKNADVTTDDFYRVDKEDAGEYIKYKENQYYSVDLFDESEIDIPYPNKNHVYKSGNFYGTIGSSNNKMLTIDTNADEENKFNYIHSYIETNKEGKQENKQSKETLNTIRIKNTGKAIAINSNNRVFSLQLDEEGSSIGSARLEFDTAGEAIGKWPSLVTNKQYDEKNQLINTDRLILGKFVAAGFDTKNTGRRQGLVIHQNGFVVVGDSTGELRTQDQIYIVSEKRHTEWQTPYYWRDNPQIVLRAGTSDPVVSGAVSATKPSTVELMLNSSNTRYMNANKQNYQMFPVFAVRTSYNDIGIYPERWYSNGYQYRENFIVHMNQIITGGLEIQKSFKGEKVWFGIGTKTDPVAAIKLRRREVGLLVGQGIQCNWLKALDGIQGNGKNIMNTADGRSVGGGNVTVDELGESDSFLVPTISLNKGRPNISSKTISIGIPSAKDIWLAIRASVIAQIKQTALIKGQTLYLSEKETLVTGGESSSLKHKHSHDIKCDKGSINGGINDALDVNAITSLKTVTGSSIQVNTGTENTNGVGYQSS